MAVTSPLYKDNPEAEKIYKDILEKPREFSIESLLPPGSENGKLAKQLDNSTLPDLIASEALIKYHEEATKILGGYKKSHPEFYNKHLRLRELTRNITDKYAVMKIKEEHIKHKYSANGRVYLMVLEGKKVKVRAAYIGSKQDFLSVSNPHIENGGFVFYVKRPGREELETIRIDIT